jgi:hypothetical protein
VPVSLVALLIDSILQKLGLYIINFLVIPFLILLPIKVAQRHKGLLSFL